MACPRTVDNSCHDELDHAGRVCAARQVSVVYIYTKLHFSKGIFPRSDCVTRGREPCRTRGNLTTDLKKVAVLEKTSSSRNGSSAAAVVFSLSSDSLGAESRSR